MSKKVSGKKKKEDQKEERRVCSGKQFARFSKVLFCGWNPELKLSPVGN